MEIRRPIVLFVAALFIGACSPSREAELRYVGRPIVDGTPDTSQEHQAVVALWMSTGGQYGYLCSGTLVAPRTVMTAAHCVDEFTPSQITVIFGDDIYGTSRGVSEREYHPGWDPDNLVNDIALVRMSNEAPAGVTPIPYLPYSLRITDSDVGTDLEFVGFGQDENGGDGVKLHVFNDLDYVCTSPGGCWWPNPGNENTICVGRYPGVTCQGDSGGPAFITRSGQEYVAGITSYGDPGCDDYGCSTKVDEFETFIEDFISGATGSDCDYDYQCDSGHCEDGICCATACTATCYACNVPGSYGSCRAAPNGWDCSDGNPCNGDEVCEDGSCQSSGGTPCDDGNPCTQDSCSSSTGCSNAPVANGTSCADSSLCNGAETCQGGQCQPGTMLDCNDSDPCTQDTCHPTLGCQHSTKADGASCSDADLCDGAETCQGGVCTAGTPLSCDDGNPCTEDGCLPASACYHNPLANNTPCDDGNACTGDGRCQAGICQTGQPLDCNDLNACTTDSCQPGTGCRHQPVADGTSCGGGLCGQASCQGGECLGSGTDCDDGNPCTYDGCDPAQGCVHSAAPDGTACEDGDPCTQADACSNGACVAGAPANCDDRDPCTRDSCGSQGCQHAAEPDGTSCGGGVCGAAFCQGGACVMDNTSMCEDYEPCTRDWCDPVEGCQHTAEPNGYACAECMACWEGVCTVLADCGDGGGCGCGQGPAGAAAGTTLLILLVLGAAARRRVW